MAVAEDMLLNGLAVAAELFTKLNHRSLQLLGEASQISSTVAQNVLFALIIPVTLERPSAAALRPFPRLCG